MEGSAMNMPLKIRVNGTLRESEVEPRVLLVEFLRESCGLTVPRPPVRLLHAGHDNDCGPAS